MNSMAQLLAVIGVDGLGPAHQVDDVQHPDRHLA